MSQDPTQPDSSRVPPDGLEAASNGPANATTDYGYERVVPEEKTRRVGGVFRSVAERYDVMNDLMSLGTHRLFKRVAVEFMAARSGQRLLDLAGGTGDLSKLLAEAVGDQGSVVLADINEAMLTEGRDRLLNAGHAQVAIVQANAEALPFADDSFDAAIIAFGFRNVARRADAAESMLRVLRPGGRLVVLEFSRPKNPLLDRAYSAYRALWPAVGRAVVGDPGPYRYLTDSIDNYPPPEAISALLEAAGFLSVRHFALAGGVASLHRAFKA